MLKLIVLVVVLLVGAVLVIAANRPDVFRVARSIDIKAPPDRIFPLIDNLRQFATWSPFEKKDPAMKRAYSGPESGKGARYEWDGNAKIGRGHLEITDSVPPSKVNIQLDMLAPIEGHNIVDFTLQAQGDLTRVTWAMQGPMPFISKLLSVFVNMDSMVGRDFEAGLADLKALAEK